MSDKQKTIEKSVTVEGSGLHTGQNGSLTFKPAPANHGIKFKRVDIEGQPVIEADINHVVSTDRGTTIAKNGASVYTIEHVLAALMGLGIDNALLEINMEEIPIKDGSSRFFVEALKEAGIKEQEARKEFIEIRETIEYSLPDENILLRIEPDDHLSIDVTIDFDTKVLGEQTARLDRIEDFVTEIAPCRTFVFLHELEFLLNNNLIKGGDLSSAIIFVNREISQQELNRLAKLFNQPKVDVKKEGILNNLDLYFNNEPARHKLLDMIGDLALLGKPIKGKITAVKPGHMPNTQFAKMIYEHLNTRQKMMKEPPFDIYAKPVYTIDQIKNIIPHRPPFLLVDKVLELSDEHIIALKTVTMNEPYFTGHFPDEPIMPAVIMVEAMAQAGGIFVLSKVDEPELYSTYFLKISEARFRRKVVPGDVLVFSIELAAPIKRGVCTMNGKAYVGNEVAVEVSLTAQIIKNKA